jgi:hypothetical protein
MPDPSTLESKSPPRRAGSIVCAGSYAASLVAAGASVVAAAASAIFG